MTEHSKTLWTFRKWRLVAIWALSLIAFATLLFAWNRAAPETGQAAGPGPGMSLDAPGTVVVGEPFTITINTAPAPDVAICCFGSEVVFPDGLKWLPRASCPDEVQVERQDGGPLAFCQSSLSTLLGGATHAVISEISAPPLEPLNVTPGSTTTLVELDFVCNTPGSYKLTLTASPDSPDGAVYASVLAQEIFVKTVLQDYDGDTVANQVADTLTIECSGEPPPTDIPAPTATAAPTAPMSVLTVDCTPLVSPGGSSFGPQNTMGMALQAVDQGADFNVTEDNPAVFRARTAAQLAAFDLIAVNNHPARLGDGCVQGAGTGLGTTWQGVIGVNSGGRVLLTSHDAPRFHMNALPGSLFFGAGSPGPGVEPFGAPDLVRQAALWAGGGSNTGLLIFNDSPGFVGGLGWDNPELNLPAAWGISDLFQVGGVGDGGYTDILPAFTGHPVYQGLSDVRFGVNTISSFSANIGDGSFDSVFGGFNAAILTPTEAVVNAGIIDVGGFGVGAGTAAAGPDGTAITLLRDEEKATPTPCPPEGCPSPTPTPTVTPTPTPTPTPLGCDLPSWDWDLVNCFGTENLWHHETSASITGMSGGTLAFNQGCTGPGVTGCTFSTGTTVAGRATSPTFTAPSGAILTFKTARSTENACGTWDRTFVLYSTNAGATYALLNLLAGSITPGGQFLATGGEICGESLTAQTVTVPLPAGTTNIAFDFNSGDSGINAFPGQFIDDVDVVPCPPEGCPTPTPCPGANGISPPNGIATATPCPPITTPTAVPTTTPPETPAGGTPTPIFTSTPTATPPATPGPSPELGWMSSGGSIFEGGRVTHGFTLHCDVTEQPNLLQVNWEGNSFHLENLLAATCSDDPAIEPNPPSADFDTYAGAGTGRYNGVSGATAEWTFTDAGEPGSNDTVEIVIRDASDNVVLSASGSLESGDHQAHGSAALVAAMDSDGDGCTNGAELGTDQKLGGQRNPHNFWDFFDTPDTAGVRDNVIAFGDVLRVVARLGTSGDASIDPLSPPGPSGYHPAFDRTSGGHNIWNLGPPDGAISLQDVVLVIAQFGHSCA